MTAIVSVRTGLRLVTKDSDAKPTSSVFLCFSWVSACQTGYTCYWEHVIVMLCKVVWASQYCLLTLQHREDCCSLAVPKCTDRSDKRSVPFQVECHVCSFCWKTDNDSVVWYVPLIFIRIITGVQRTFWSIKLQDRTSPWLRFLLW